MKTQREVDVQLHHFFNFATRWDGWSTPRPSRITSEKKEPVPILQAVGWDSIPVWTGVENLAPTKTRSPNPEAGSKSLRRLRNPGRGFRTRGH